jgi:hypothetical protein
MNKDQTKGNGSQRKARALIPVSDEVAARRSAFGLIAEADALRCLNFPTLLSMRGRLVLASVALVARITKRHKLHVAEHVGVFAGSPLHRGDWDHNQP